MALRGHGVYQLQKALSQQVIAIDGPLGDMAMFMQLFMQQQQQQKIDAFMQMSIQLHETNKQMLLQQQQKKSNS